MKLKSDLPVVDIDGESIIVFAPDEENAFRGMLRSNPTAKFIMGCLYEDTDEEAILKKMQEEYDGDEAEMREDIAMVIDNLRKADAFEE